MTEPLPPESARLIESLHAPDCYPHSAADIQLIETHISWVLLTGEFAYKIKKPVDLGFVDFSTLDRRKFFCDEELRLNGRLAESIYLSAVPITGTSENPCIQGEGEAIEYAVKMRQFPQEALLSHAIENEKLHWEHIDKLAEEIADFHQRIDVARPEEGSWKYGTAEKAFAAAFANFQALLDQEIDDAGAPSGESQLPEEFQDTRPQLLELLEWTRKEAERLKEPVEDRREEGAVRECHGDMHLGNMLLEGDEVLVFDGIDFNADLRWIDVLSEIAFCVMDLIDRGRPDFAWRLLNRYLEHTGDYAGLDVLPFFLTYRALVRAKVAHLGYEQHDQFDAEARKASAESRREYLDLATNFTKPRTRFLAITHGVSGSGKSLGTERLMEDLGAIRVRSDVERKRLAGLDRLETSGSDKRDEMYSAEFSKRTYERLAGCAEAILKAGFPVILDATFLKKEQREMLRNSADDLDVPFQLLDFQASEAELRRRLLARENDPSEAGLDVLNKQLEDREELTAAEQALAISIDTEQSDFAASIAREVSRRRQQG